MFDNFGIQLLYIAVDCIYTAVDMHYIVITEKGLA